MLKRKGFDVGRVINIDQPVHSEIRKSSFWKRIGNWLIRLKYPRASMQDLIRTQKVNRIRRNQAGSPENEDSQLVEQNLPYLDDFYRGIAQNYTPTTNDLEMTLIRGELFQAKFELPKDYGWSKVVKSLRVVCISGSHSTIFQKRFIKGLRKAFVEAYQGVI